ncbi:MAG: TMEM143 family protein [Hyphomicrobiaceae bacterium]
MPSVAAKVSPPVVDPRKADSAARPPSSITISLSPGLEDEKLPGEECAVEEERETFIPVTRFALMDRLTQPQAWPPGTARAARRFFMFLDHWRHQQHLAAILELEQAYEPFSPDTDLLLTRKFTEQERRTMLRRVVDSMSRLLVQANYKAISRDDADIIMTADSHYGLDLHVDFDAFEEILIYYRGASVKRSHRRSLRKFLRKEEFDVPIYQRLFLLFKLKPFEVRVREVMAKERLPIKEARKVVHKLRGMLPPEVREENVYMKLFKNIPRTDLEMVFPNTTVRFRLRDKLKLGVGGAGGFGMTVAGAIGKIGAMSNPIVAAGVLASVGGVAFRQFMGFLNQKQKYMVVMAQNLYFHSMADNRSVMIKVADRAAEEDVKEEMLLYTVLVKERARRADLPIIDQAIEQYLNSEFGVTVDFDLEDALSRLLADGLVREMPDGTLVTLQPREAALHLDAKWDSFLDNLPDPHGQEGVEFQGDAAQVEREVAVQKEAARRTSEEDGAGS